MTARTPRAAWTLALLLGIASRVWNAVEGPVLKGYDAPGHIAYVLFLDLYHSIPYADQGWSYFHPPLHYLLGLLLAQAGDAVVLVRGLALVSSAASLGTAGVAAWIVRRALPERPLLAPLAFVAVAFVPVHVYTSPMPGNEQTGAFLSTLGFALFVRNQMRPRPSAAADLAAGLVLGLALLAKFSALLPLVTAEGVLALGALRDPARRAAGGRALRRGALLGGAALLVCAPYYARNVATFGTPLKLSRDTPLVAGVEGGQLPGSRSWRDLVDLSPRTLTQPVPTRPHLLHSIWGSLYVSTWTDPRFNNPLGPSLVERRLVWPGLIPTALALLGLGVSVRRGLRSRDAQLDLAVVGLSLANLAAFVVMAYRVPTFAMLKASYLLQLSLPYAVFLSRALVELERRGLRWAARGAAVWIVLLAVGTAGIYAPGLVRGRGGENVRMAPLYAYFGDLERARERCSEALSRVLSPSLRASFNEALAAVLLDARDTARARTLYERVREVDIGASRNIEPRDSPWVTNRLAVAAALDGDREGARRLLDELLARAAAPEILVNRGALRALAGDLAGAESDLRRALQDDASLAAAWHDLARVLDRRGEAQGAQEAQRRAARFARVAPRGFPYGVGDGFHLAAQRYMLLIEGDGLALYRPGRSRVQ